MKIFWTEPAEQDRVQIWEYIAADNPYAAARMDSIFGNAAARLAEHPRLGKPGAVPGTREIFPHESYRLVYEVEGETLWIHALVHAARSWPPVAGRD